MASSRHKRKIAKMESKTQALTADSNGVEPVPAPTPKQRIPLTPAIMMRLKSFSDGIETCQVQRQSAADKISILEQSRLLLLNTILELSGGSLDHIYSLDGEELILGALKSETKAE